MIERTSTYLACGGMISSLVGLFLVIPLAFLGSPFAFVAGCLLLGGILSGAFGLCLILIADVTGNLK